mmetsp:Transcript_13867/g.34155  ORF Transcript_13867/g.34155 Transcript_13867/m.34155 type:complete len:447 (-) Transcript_13867:101-1441(-)|eukprot:CAMPEP_0198321774 /NCGR_PEP_ID=MMETSP1450-20131203/10411_1 /TAXON_ID=753684 ORGANISM="Madagascaria erythrocladiodes, Strain CCMP3234" /NCGR_SAMPLE_ID=MMETSP1450 /ASSEMBLY_ACC=CAM_ASM_001115 /LENGTH=446 /DNA_ID=CAMNT_0044025355 /DNA_START=51 /DNA_END=1391 /DNA_ORIENTATION=+
MLTLAIAATAAAVAGAAAARERYDGHQVVSGVVKNAATAELLEGLDIWQPDSGEVRINSTVHVRLPAADAADGAALRKRLAAAHFAYDVLIEDVQRLVDHERAAMAAAPAAVAGVVDDTWFESYHTYAEIVDATKALANGAPSGANAKFFDNIGQSETGDHTLVGLTIRAGGDGGERPVFWFNGGQHAREWIGPATSMYILYKLLQQYAAGDPEVVAILNALDIVFVPVANPDGYEYSRTDSRMWRKNRKVNSGSSCRGVDLNRNWAYKWGGGGTSGNPCSDIYRGVGAFSEAETQALRDFIRAQGAGRVIGAVDMHSYSQLILRAYGWTRADAKDETENRALGEQMKATIASVHGKDYKNIKSIDLYTTTGSAGDWYYEMANGDEEGVEANRARVAYTFELRDTGNYGFVLPPDQIIPTGEENYAAYLDMLKHLQQNPCLPGQCA